jgi:hypothetical protein
MASLGVIGPRPGVAQFRAALAWQRFRMDTGPIGVRRLPLGVVISVAAHGALGALVYAAYDPAAHRAPDLPPVVVELVAVEVPPLAAPAVPDEPPDEPPPSPDEPPPPSRAAPRPPAAPARASISTTTGATVETAPAPAGPDVAPGATPPARSRWFDLRRGRPAVDLRLPQGSHDDLDQVPRGTGPAPSVAPTGQLHDAPGGGRRADQGVFTAEVAPDGTVKLKDQRNVRVGLALPTPRSIGNGVSRWYYSDKGPDGQRGERALEKDVGGSVDTGDRSKSVIVPVVRGGFDVTDAFMRRKGMDPYASKKLAFLDSTRDERVQLGAAHREQQLQKTSQLVQRNLDQLWQRVPDPAGRRAALFELWDEIVETGDERVVEAGRAARRLVVGFIRARLPAGGPDAYTADELAALNRRRQSRTPFAPYE